MIDYAINDDRTLVGGGKGLILARRYHILCQLGQSGIVAMTGCRRGMV